MNIYFKKMSWKLKSSVLHLFTSKLSTRKFLYILKGNVFSIKFSKISFKKSVHYSSSREKWHNWFTTFQKNLPILDVCYWRHCKMLKCQMWLKIFRRNFSGKFGLVDKAFVWLAEGPELAKKWRKIVIFGQIYLCPI